MNLAAKDVEHELEIVAGAFASEQGLRDSTAWLYASSSCLSRRVLNRGSREVCNMCSMN